MKKGIPYLTQYCNLRLEWHYKGLTVDNVTESQAEEQNVLREKAIEQSGLTANELILINLCRKHGFLTKVHIYARKLINLK